MNEPFNVFPPQKMPRISEAVKHDHALIKRAYRRLRDADPENRNPNEFMWALNRYLIVEDLVMSPTLDNHVARGGERHRRLSEDYDSVSLASSPLEGFL